MLKIRLQRSGRKNRANYRIVVAEHSAPIKGKYIEMLGTFDPLIDKHGFVVDVKKVQSWIEKGAKPSNTVARLLKGQGVSGMDSFIVDMKDRKVKNPKEPVEEATAPSTEIASSKETESEASKVDEDKSSDKTD